MKFKGLWACPDYFDSQLNIDHDFANITLSESGIFDHPMNECTMNGDTLTWSFGDIHCTLTYTEEDSLIKAVGIAVKNGAETKVEFYKFEDEPFYGKPHIAPYDAPLSIPKEFGITRNSLIGKWRSPVPYNCSMDFFPASDDKLRVMLTFGKNSHAPTAVYFEENALVWLINDSANRGRCILRAVDGHLIGTFTQLGHSEFPAVDFIKVSDTHSVEENPLAPLNLSRIDILRKYAAYGEPENSAETTYILNQEIPEMVYELGFTDYIENKSDDALAFACLDFVCDHWVHNSYGCPPRANRTLLDCVEYIESHGRAANCRCLSIILSNLLRAVGIRAQHVTCMPYEEPFNDCHVVVDCILPSGKRVMMDPTYHLYFTDANGEAVSLHRLREMLISGETLVPCKTFGYHHKPSSLDEYLEYMSKNAIRFEKGQINEDGNDCREPMILAPCDYPIESTDYAEHTLIFRDPAAFWGE